MRGPTLFFTGRRTGGASENVRDVRDVQKIKPGLSGGYDSGGWKGNG
jgi:hypothetical protein